MEVLYQVIIENQKARTALLKWKLLLVTAVAGIAFGTRNLNLDVPRTDALLGCIPLLVAYVDLLCSHLSLRVQVIGRFIRISKFSDDSQAKFSEYEKFVDRTRLDPNSPNAFVLESWAMYASSMLLSWLVIVYGIYILSSSVGMLYSSLFLVSGILGVLLEWRILDSYRERHSFINSLQLEEVNGAQV